MFTVIRIDPLSDFLQLPVPVFTGIKDEAVFKNVFSYHKMVACISRHLLLECHRKNYPSLDIHLTRIFTNKCGHTPFFTIKTLKYIKNIHFPPLCSTFFIFLLITFLMKYAIATALNQSHLGFLPFYPMSNLRHPDNYRGGPGSDQGNDKRL